MTENSSPFEGWLARVQEMDREDLTESLYNMLPKEAAETFDALDLESARACFSWFVQMQHAAWCRANATDWRVETPQTELEDWDDAFEDKIKPMVFAFSQPRTSGEAVDLLVRGGKLKKLWDWQCSDKVKARVSGFLTGCREGRHPYTLREVDGKILVEATE